MRLQSAIHAYKQHGQLSKGELFGLFLTALTFGFVLSFRRWGSTEFDVVVGFTNLLLYACIAFLTLLCMTVTQKFFAIKLGYQSKYHMWGAGLGLTLIFAFLTNGIPLLLTPGGMIFKSDFRYQLGYYLKGPVIKRMGHVAFWGLFSNVVLGAIVSILPLESSIQYSIMLSIFLIGIFSLVPVDGILSIWLHETPNSIGSVLMGQFALSGRGYNFVIFTLTFFFSSWALLFFTGPLGILWGILLGTLMMLYWMFFMSPKRFYN